MLVDAWDNSVCFASIAALYVVAISVLPPVYYDHWLPSGGIESGILEPTNVTSFEKEL